MATDVEKLVVQLSADFKSYENAMAKASGITRKELAAIKASAEQAGNAGAAAFNGASRGVVKFGTDARKAQGAVNNMGGATANLAAQFQDIGVQLQGGTSPLTIALQQGTQISAVLGQNGAAGAVKALGAAFASVISPMSLLTVGLIAAGGYAVQYFASLISGGDSSAKELQRQADLIQKIAQRWGETLPGLAAYAAEMQRAADAADILEAAEITQAQITETLQEKFAKLAETYRVSISLIPDVNREFGVLAGKIESGHVAASDFDVILGLLAAVLRTETSPALEELNAVLIAIQASAGAAAVKIETVGNEAAIAAGKIRDFKAAEAMRTSTREVLADAKAYGDEIERQAGLSERQLAAEERARSIRQQAKSEGTVISQPEAERLAGIEIAAEERREAEAKAARDAAKGGGAGAASKAVKEAEREREAVTKLIEQLEYEASIVGLSNLEKEKANALRRAGAAATPEETAKIQELVIATYAHVEALKKTEEGMEALRGLSRDVLGGMVDDLLEGASAAEVLSNALAKVADALITAGINTAISGMFPTPGATPQAGTNFLANVLHSGGIVGQAGHKRSVPEGIFVNAPRYHGGGVAGLNPGEVPAILQRGEKITPKGGGRGVGAIAVDVSGARGNAEIMTMVEAGVSRGLRAYDSTMPQRVMKISHDPRKRK